MQRLPGSSRKKAGACARACLPLASGDGAAALSPPLHPPPQALADAVSEEQLGRKEMYPEITQLRSVSAKVGGGGWWVGFFCGLGDNCMG